MEGLLVEETNKLLYGVLCCKNSTCAHHKPWNRDVNASINITQRLLRDVQGTPHPEVFLRRPVAPGEIFGALEVELVVNDVAEEQQLIHDGDAPSR